MAAVKPAASACLTSSSSWDGGICSWEQWKPMVGIRFGPLRVVRVAGGWSQQPSTRGRTGRNPDAAGAVAWVGLGRSWVLGTHEDEPDG